MTDLRAFDHSQVRPDFTDYASGWARTHLIPVTPMDPRLAAVTAAIGATHVNGGAEVAQFRIEADPAVAWYLSRNQVEIDFFRDFFGHEAVCKRLSAGRTMKLGSLGFYPHAPFEALGAQRGGAYRSFSGDDRRVCKLANGFAAAAIAQRFSEAAVWSSQSPWSEWFFDVAWDNSFFWLDKREGMATVLLITDTD